MVNDLTSLDAVAIWAQLPTERARGQFLELLRLLVKLHNASVPQTRQSMNKRRSPETLRKNLGPPRAMSPYQ